MRWRWLFLAPTCRPMCKWMHCGFRRSQLPPFFPVLNFTSFFLLHGNFSRPEGPRFFLSLESLNSAALRRGREREREPRGRRCAGRSARLPTEDRPTNSRQRDGDRAGPPPLTRLPRPAVDTDRRPPGPRTSRGTSQAVYIVMSRHITEIMFASDVVAAAGWRRQILAPAIYIHIQSYKPQRRCHGSPVRVSACIEHTALRFALTTSQNQLLAFDILAIPSSQHRPAITFGDGYKSPCSFASVSFR